MNRENRSVALIGVGLLVLAAVMAAGAAQIRGEAGYAGAGPNFLPWVIAAAFAALGVATLLGARRHAEPLIEAPPDRPSWTPLAWISVGLLLNAVLIEHIGFIASCALLFALAARGFRIGEDQRPSWLSLGQDILIGAALSAPVFWMFTKLLGVNLPSLVVGGWI